MKTIRLFSIALTVAMLFTSSALFAQLKVGTNPTTIGANSNLEVEASTAGRKLTVDKTTGQVTIADGSQAAGKVLTSDVNGASSWQSVASVVGLGQLRAIIQGYGVGGTLITTLKYVGVSFNDITGAAVDGPNGVISLPAGVYRITAGISISFNGPNNPANQGNVNLYVNGALYQILGAQCVPAAGTAVTIGGSAVFKLAAAGQISIIGGAQTPAGYTLQESSAHSIVTLEKIQ